MSTNPSSESLGQIQTWICQIVSCHGDCLLSFRFSTLYVFYTFRSHVNACHQYRHLPTKLGKKKHPHETSLGWQLILFPSFFFKVTFQRLSSRPDGMRAPQSHSCLNLTASPSVRCSSGLALDPRNSRVPVSPSLHHFTSETGIRQEHFTGFSCLFLEPFSRAAAEGYFHSA